MQEKTPYIKNKMIRQELIVQLSELSKNPNKIDRNLNEAKHGKTVIQLIVDDFNLTNAFYKLNENTNFMEDDTSMNVVKEISMITLVSPSTYNSFDEKTMKVKPEMINYLAKYLIKRRATYLYIFMLFQKKHIELLKIQKLLGDKYDELKNVVLSQGGIVTPVVDLHKLLLEVQTAILKVLQTNPKNKDLMDKILLIFNNSFQQIQVVPGQIDFINIFTSLGQLMQELNSKSDGYRALVHDVIPVIAQWNENVV